MAPPDPSHSNPSLHIPIASGVSSVGTGSGLPLPYAQASIPIPKKETRGPNRTSKTTNKLKVLPTTAADPGKPHHHHDEDVEHPNGSSSKAGVSAANQEDMDEGEGVEFYTPIDQIPAGSARRDALRLTKTEKAKLPRVTAYCTAASFNLPALQSYLSSRPSSYHCHPRLFESDCLHTPYLPPPPVGSSTKKTPTLPPSTPAPRSNALEGDLLGLDRDDGTDHGLEESEGLLAQKRNHQIDEAQDRDRERERNDDKRHPQRRQATGFSTRPGSGAPKRRHSRTSLSGMANGAESGGEDDDYEEEEWVPDVFVFEYGTVVIWGMTEREEKRLLASLRKFEIEKLNIEDVEMEDLNFYYASYSRIYNDVITLRKGSSFMTKLSLSHALSQSVKISLFEELISATIEQTRDLPRSLSETGKIGMPRKEIMKQIGSLFILRINWGGSILDSPEFFWSYPDLEPLYQAARSYLEIGQRIDLLNARVVVLQDMLTLLKESVNSSHGERLETIVIVLIGVEIILGIMTILVDVLSS